MLGDLKRFIEFKSVQDAPQDGAPFGAELKNTLDWFLAKAKAYGLETKNLDGYCGWAEIPGSGKEMMGILCHLDVVPADNYEFSEKDGYYCGRGVADDKGPAIVLLHVLKRLQEEGFKPNHRIRLIAGCNEETGSACVKHYIQKAEIPAFSIVPDADFPAVVSEKGILHLELYLDMSDAFQRDIWNIRFGARPNIVPDSALVVFGNETIHKPNRLETKGVSGHAMEPEKGQNASWALFDALKDDYPECKAVFRYLCQTDGNALGIACGDEKSGKLTMNLGCGIYNHHTACMRLTLDFRLPLCISKDAVMKAVQKAFPEGRMTEKYYAPNLYHDPESPLIQTLLRVYESVTGKQAAPVKTGGGTYARAFPNAVAFGPTFPGEDYKIHNDGERIPKENLQKWFDLYYKAVLELDKLQNL